MNPLTYAAQVLARIYEASSSAPVPVDLADDEDTEPVPVVREVRWPSPYRPDCSHDTDYAGTGPSVAAAEDRVLVELAVLTDSHGPWDAARRMFASDTPSASLSAMEAAEHHPSGTPVSPNALRPNQPLA